jgi:adenylate cyclase class 2
MFARNEIEVKVLEIDRNKIETKLLSLGAKKVFDDEIYALHFDDDDKSIKSSGKVLRLRKEGHENTFTLKIKDKDKSKEVKFVEETELNISDFEKMRFIIENIGFKMIDDSRKHRTSYKLDNMSFEFDKLIGRYSHIPEYLEIEAYSESDLNKAIEILELDKKNCLPWSQPDVVRYYEKKN